MRECHLTVEQVKELVTYNPSTGRFTRNSSGKLAGNIAPVGYWRLGLDGVSYYAANVAWYIMTNEWPQITVDHKDQDKLNDAWDNLRLASRSQNAANRPNTKGVYYHASAGKWAACIKVEGATKHLGLYTNEEDARAVFIRAHIKQFGEFSPFYQGPST